MSSAAYAQDRMDRESVTASRMDYARESRKRIVKASSGPWQQHPRNHAVAARARIFFSPYTDRCGHDTEAEGQRKPGEDFPPAAMCSARLTTA
jgi:hypothetical protein